MDTKMLDAITAEKILIIAQHGRSERISDYLMESESTKFQGAVFAKIVRRAVERLADIYPPVLLDFRVDQILENTEVIEKNFYKKRKLSEENLKYLINETIDLYVEIYSYYMRKI
jgi:hypothetical protein